MESRTIHVKYKFIEDKMRTWSLSILFFIEIEHKLYRF